MKKALKTVLILVLILAVLGGAVGGFLLWRHNRMYISKNEALAVAAADAGVAIPAMHERDVDFERHAGQAWYSVEFDSGAREWDYAIDAVTGEILSAQQG